MAHTLSQFKKLEDTPILVQGHTVVPQYWAGPTKSGTWTQITYYSIDGSEIDEALPEVVGFLSDAQPIDQHLFKLG